MILISNQTRRHCVNENDDSKKSAFCVLYVRPAMKRRADVHAIWHLLAKTLEFFTKTTTILLLRQIVDIVS